jgi:hypothetical protein
MKKTIAIIIIVLTLTSCKEKKKENLSKKNMNVEFISRIHTPEFETDEYKTLGTTTLEKHLSDFEKINWKKDFWNEFNSGNFNMSDLEVLSVNDSKYLTIMTAPNTDDTFQFIIGFGIHTETSASTKPNRKVKLYMTESENNEIPKKYIDLFFKRDFNLIKEELNKITLMEEIEDLYININ